MVPPISQGAPAHFVIEAIQHDFFELRLVPGRLDRLKALLKASEYRGRSEEAQISSDALLTRTQLDEQVQASVAELQEALHELGAIDFNGYLRLISKEVIRESIKQLLDAILENGLNLASISMSACMKYIPCADPLLMRQAVLNLGKLSGSGDDEFELNERRVAAWSAEIIMWNRMKENKRTVRIYSMWLAAMLSAFNKEASLSYCPCRSQRQTSCRNGRPRHLELGHVMSLH